MKIDFGKLIGTAVSLLPGGTIPGVIGKVAPTLLEKLAGKSDQVPGKPSFLEILDSESILNVVSELVGRLIRSAFRNVPNTEHVLDRIGRLFKKIGDAIDG